MNLSQPARCILKASSMPKGPPRPQCRSLYASPSLSQRRRPRFASIKASDMGLISGQSANRPAREALRPYDDKEKEELAKIYTPEQLRVIEEGEAAIDLEDLRLQGRFRIDPYKLPYLDDLSTIQPVVDRKVREVGTIPDNARLMNQEETVDEVARWLNQEQEQDDQDESVNEIAGLLNNKRKSDDELDRWLNQDGEKYDQDEESSPNQASSKSDTKDEFPSRLDFMKFLENSTSMTGGGKRGSGIVAPALPKIPDMKGQYQTKEDSDIRDPDGKYTRLRKQTGMTLDQILELKKKILVRHNVTNQTRLGKISSAYMLAVAGDGRGRLGIGEGKALELDDAQVKAIQAAIRNMRPIPRYENRTIYGEVKGKVGACVVQLKSKPPGTFMAYSTIGPYY